MSILSIFKNHTPDDFNHDFQIELGLLKTEIDLELMWGEGGSFGSSPSVNSLADLLKNYPDVFDRVIRPVREPGRQLKDRSQHFFQSAAFQAVWLQESQEVFESTFDFQTWLKLSYEIEDHGAHLWLHKMPYNDPGLCTGALWPLISFVFDSDKVSKHDAEYDGPWNHGSSQSLRGFGLKPALGVDKNEQLKEDTVAFFATNSLDRVPHSVHDALREMVYNEALRLKSCQYPTHQIVNRLEERIGLVFDQAVGKCTEIPSSTIGRLFPLFHRQVLINALAGFPGDLAYLDAAPDECYGHIHRNAKPCDIDLVASLGDAAETRCLESIFWGPAFITSYTSCKFKPINFALSLEDKGVPLSMDAALTGSINSLAFIKDVITLKRVSPSLDAMFSDLTRNGGLSGKRALATITYAGYFSAVNELSLLGKTGYAIGLIELGRERVNSHLKNLANEENKHYRPLGTMGRPDRVVQSDPAIRSHILKYLKESGPLQHDMLQWCGFGHEVLSELDSADADNLSEHFLGADLGL